MKKKCWCKSQFRNKMQWGICRSCQRTLRCICIKWGRFSNWVKLELRLKRLHKRIGFRDFISSIIIKSRLGNFVKLSRVIAQIFKERWKTLATGINTHLLMALWFCLISCMWFRNSILRLRFSLRLPEMERLSIEEGRLCCMKAEKGRETPMIKSVFSRSPNKFTISQMKKELS